MTTLLSPSIFECTLERIQWRERAGEALGVRVVPDKPLGGCNLGATGTAVRAEECPSERGCDAE